MELHPGWENLAVRLFLSVAAGLILGLNRLERGRAAGLRTMLMVTLAAAVSMVLTNLILDTNGRPSDSFATMDTMRLPLGILTGIGFIGAGAILRRGEMIMGITTAATIWLATVIGLCFGAGYLMLGGVVTAIAVLALWGFHRIEIVIAQDRRGTLVVRSNRDGPGEDEIRRQIVTADFWLLSWEIVYNLQAEGEGMIVEGIVGWRGSQKDFHPPGFVTALSRQPGVREVRWKA